MDKEKIEDVVYKILDDLVMEDWHDRYNSDCYWHEWDGTTYSSSAIIKVAKIIHQMTIEGKIKLD